MLETTSDVGGSIWRRWDPHIHTPGTLLNDQYGGGDAWNAFLSQIEATDPPISALGTTDYLSIGQYEAIAREKVEGRLANVKLIFPNVEMRFSIGTGSGSGVNAHLLFSPDDPNHVQEINRFLHRLEFRYTAEIYRCCRDDLIRLGRRHQPEVVSDSSALAVGANQFKVNFEQLQDEWGKSEWVRKNCLVAVAVGERDGTSGVRDHGGSFEALRKSIEAFAHIIFSSSPSQIDFWLGRRGATVHDLESKWGGMKPCLHGSDAHSQDRVGKPDNQRACWIKGDLTFESLRQACIEPEGRVHIGSHPPRGAMAGNTIQKLDVSNAPWMNASTIKLNSGLVAVIGARGSGKTALADLIAAGGLVANARLNPKSFLVRAEEHLEASRAQLVWENGQTTESDLSRNCVDASPNTPRVQYLSQQFVDDLCSSEGLSDSLVAEVQRVIFDAHPVDEREGSTSFDELFALRSATAIARRERHETELESASDALMLERQLKRDLPAHAKRRDELVKQIADDQKDREALIGKGNEVRAKRHGDICAALDVRRGALVRVQSKLRALESLKADVLDISSRRAPLWLDELQRERADSELTAAEWNSFKLEFIGDVNSILQNRLQKVSAESRFIAGDATVPTAAESQTLLNAPLIADNANLAEVTVTLLLQESNRLAKLIGIDTQNAKQFAALSEKIAKSSKALEKLNALIATIQTSDQRIQELVGRRKEAYAGIFGAFIELEHQLNLLYAPLQTNLNSASGSLRQLGFAVRRQVNIEQWAEKGEALLDLRRNGPFKGLGALLEAARTTLLVPWQSGSPEEISTAMQSFISDYEGAIREHRPERADARDWASSISKWLHDTRHVMVSYGLQYDGVEVERLSPGTRGIVLLLLYLTIDEQDDRPLIIDQPEENLDPQSIFDELVSRFRTTKTRRQVIIVTHNANLVVNTDADQVIVASAGPHRPGELPKITYESGGLENPLIRKRVCDILEGGERAFRARARRLRLGLNETSIQQIAVP